LKSDWQTCYVQANNAGGLADMGNMVSNFPTSMAFLGQQTLVYTWLAFAVMFRSLCHYEWLPSTIAFMLYAVLGVVAYYSFNPFIPLPHQTPATVASMTAYIRHDMYKDMYDDDDDDNEYPNCDKAYHFNLAFLVIQYVSVAVVLLLLVVALKANFIRMRYPSNNQLPPLSGYKVPVALSAVALCGYTAMVVAKASASITVLDQIRNPSKSQFAPESATYIFPFAQGTVDIATIMLIVSGMSVIRGTSRQSTSAFRLASVAAILHVALSYPSVVGNLKTMAQNSLWTDGSFPTNLISKDGDGCYNFMYQYYYAYYNELIYWNDSTDSTDITSTMCRDISVAGVSQLVIFCVMHIQIFACLYVYKNNKGRPTDVYDPHLPTGQNNEPLLHHNLVKNSSEQESLMFTPKIIM